MRRVKVVSADEAVSLIPDEAVIAFTGFGVMAHPETLSAALERRFLATGHPRNITAIFAAGQGGSTDEVGVNHLAHVGLLKRAIGGHYRRSPRMMAIAVANLVEAYNLPQGIISHLYREAAGGRPGVITHVGLGTYVDPRLEGGKCNAMTTEDLVEVVQLAGREWLFYKAICPTVTFIRGTYADEWGNISIDKEPVHTEALSAAQAAHNAGGLVLAQVEKIVPAGSIHPKKVRIPGIIVDYVVVDPHQWQTRLAKFDPTLTGDERKEFTALEPMPLDERKVIARRAAQEVKAGDVVNLGIGMPEGVAAVAAEEGRIEDFTLTVESGPVGGMPMSDAQFGASLNPVAIVDQPAQFDFYDGGGLNITCLGMGQMDEEGNVNVSRFGKVLAGCGGFINISQNARRVVFCGSFTGSGLEVKVGGGKIEIVKEGRTKKLLKAVEQITFSGNYARSIHQHVLYVTERAVFELLSAGLTLIELAPGINLEKDILANMDFVPLISSNVREMDQKFFE